MKKTSLKIAIAVFVATLIVSIIFGTYYYKALRDHILPSSPQNLTMQANVNETELRIAYRWRGFKEYYTYADYIIIRYKYKNIEFNYDGMNLSKEFYKSIKYLQDDFYTPRPLSSEKELVVQVDNNSRKGEIIIPIKSRDAEIENITIYYAHEVSLPMDIPTGWVSKKVNIIH